LSEAARQVRATPLTGGEWAPFGWIPVRDTDPHDGAHRLTYEWDDVHVNLVGHDLDEVESIKGGLRCDVLFRHRTHTQVLMPLDSDAVIAVAGAPVDFSEQSNVENVRAFTIRPLEAVVLHCGTWHWGPYPVGNRRVTLFNVQGWRYQEDNLNVDLAGKGLSVDILID
jgi:ureidoglycolate hydrolase